MNAATILVFCVALVAAANGDLFADVIGAGCKEFTCPEQSTGELVRVDPNDCHFYHRCTYGNGVASSEIFMCGLGQYFDSSLSKCVSPGTTGERCFTKTAKHRCLLALMLQKQSLATGEESQGVQDDDDDAIEAPFSEVSESTPAPTVLSLEDDGSGEEPIGFTCAADNNPCNGQPGACNFHFANVNPGKFVQCSEWGSCYEMPCPGGLVWKEENCVCSYP